MTPENNNTSSNGEVIDFDQFIKGRNSLNGFPKLTDEADLIINHFCSCTEAQDKPTIVMSDDVLNRYDRSIPDFGKDYSIFNGKKALVVNFRLPKQDQH